MYPELESYAMVSSSWMFVIGRRWGPGFIPDATLGMYGNSRRALRMHDFLPLTKHRSDSRFDSAERPLYEGSYLPATAD